MRNIEEAEREHPIQLLSSTYIPLEHRIRDSYMVGTRIMTFAQILKYDLYPLPQILTELLTFGREGMGCEIEIEFAVNLASDPGQSVFHFLQMRPMVTGAEDIDVQIEEEEVADAFCFSGHCLGHGRFADSRVILLVRPERFDPSRTVDIAREIGHLNRKLEAQSRPYLLIGPGRWGSADHWLGIPVQWSDISGVRAIIEIRSEQLRADPSQGSHFFQNITSLGIPYLTVSEYDNGRDDEENCASGLSEQVD